MVDQVLFLVLGKSDDCSAVSSIRDLYLSIANTSFKNKDIESFILQNFEFRDTIPTLYEDYKADFSPLEWKTSLFV